MQRHAIVGVLISATSFFGATTATAEPVAVIVRAETCLRANVDRVVALEGDLQSAASFLVTYACADETARAAKYERNTAWLISMRGFVKASSEMSPKNPAFGSDIDATVDPTTGDFVIPPPKPGAPPNIMTSMLASMSTTSAIMMPDTPSSGLRKLAGALVVAARERRAADRR